MSLWRTCFEKTTKAFQSGFYSLVGDDKKITLTDRETIEDMLILADIGPRLSSKVVDDLLKKLPSKVDLPLFKQALADELTTILHASQQEKKRFSLFTEAAETKTSSRKLRTIVFLGVNGAGKTTTAGKVVHYLTSVKKEKVLLAACDTYRAAAVEQIQSWGDRYGAQVIKGENGADSSSVAYRALQEARNLDMDWLLVDTAGRLHNNTGLMAELQKIVRVLKKQDATMDVYSLMVLDATTGQNAKQQAQEFNKAVALDGLIITKVDGTAKAGMVIPLVQELKVPVVALGIGEQVENLIDFDEKKFIHSLVDL